MVIQSVHTVHNISESVIADSVIIEFYQTLLKYPKQLSVFYTFREVLHEASIFSNNCILVPLSTFRRFLACIVGIATGPGGHSSPSIPFV